MKIGTYRTLRMQSGNLLQPRQTPDSTHKTLKLKPNPRRRAGVADVSYNPSMKFAWDGFDEIIDVRSPSEYAEDGVPGAVNLPALSDAERAEIGLLHRDSPFEARRRGAGMLAANIALHLRAHLAERPAEWRPLVYCKRGGQRSGAVVEVLRRVGWDACQLPGGYKVYRQAVLDGLQTLPSKIQWQVLGGKTGAGKTSLLAALRESGAAVLDLEALGNHRGSAFGGNGEQPSQRRFESRLFAELSSLPQDQPVFAEAEGRKIGLLHMPQKMLQAIRRAPVFYLDANLQHRAQKIVSDYPEMTDFARFESAASAIEKFVGVRRREFWRACHTENKWQELAADMLLSFYDVGYQKSLAANYGTPREVLPVNPNCPDSLQQTAQLLRKKARVLSGSDTITA